MNRRLLSLLLLGLLAGERPAPAAVPVSDSTLVSTRALIRRLHAAGRAVADVRATVADPLTGKTSTLRGTLALELPHAARLDFSTGERLTLRQNGGEWLQPELRQLIQAGPQSTGAILDWWGVLLEQSRARFSEIALGARAYRVQSRDDGDGIAQRISLGADGLPAQIELETSGEAPRSYRLSGWRFTRPRGAAAFILVAPAGYDVVRMP
jgi:hypothetical protein